MLKSVHLIISQAKGVDLIVLTTYYNLASFLFCVGLISEALEMLEVLSQRRKICGEFS